MSFFDDLDIGGIASSLGAIGASFFGSQNDLPNDVEDILDRQKDATDAIMNPNDPRFLALARSLEHDKISSFAEGIRNYMMQLNRGNLTGAVNPERRDEGISQAFGKARQAAGEEARQQARAYLATAAGVNAGGIGLAPALMQQQQNENMATAGGIGAVSDLLGILLSNRSPQTVVNMGGSTGSVRPSIRSSYGSANAASYSDPARYYG